MKQSRSLCEERGKICELNARIMFSRIANARANKRDGFFTWAYLVEHRFRLIYILSILVIFFNRL